MSKSALFIAVWLDVVIIYFLRLLDILSNQEKNVAEEKKWLFLKCKKWCLQEMNRYISFLLFS